jgi:hypothetical protein
MGPDEIGDRIVRESEEEWRKRSKALTRLYWVEWPMRYLRMLGVLPHKGSGSGEL